MTVTKSDFLLRSRYFLTAAREGSIGRGSMKLSMGAPQLSREIAKLEAELGVTLLIRSASGVNMTGEGASFAEWIAPIISKLDQIEDSIGQGSRREVTLWIPSFLGTELFSQWLSSFREIHPESRITVKYVNPGDELSRSTFNYRIQMRRQPDDDNLIAIRLSPMPLVNVASSDYLNRTGDVMDPESLDQHELWLASVSERPVVIRHSQSGEFKTVNISSAKEAGTFAEVRSHVRVSDGIGIGVPYFMVEQELKSRTLVEILPEWKLEPEVLWFMRPPSRYPSLIGQQLVSWFREEAKKRL